MVFDPKSKENKHIPKYFENKKCLLIDPDRSCPFGNRA